MPSTAAGAIAGAVGGGVIGASLGSFDLGVITGAVIGSAVSVIASKDNNKKKAILFVLSLAVGVTLSELAEKILNDVTGYEVSRLFAAILVSALFVPIMIIIADRDNLEKGIKWILRILEGKIDTIFSALEKWRQKK